jgi:hypothetical protein
MSKIQSVKWHGEVRIYKIDEIPQGAQPVPRVNGQVVLATGETGNPHYIEAETATLLSLEDELFLHVTGDRPVQVAHNEHNLGPVEPGVYGVGQKREYDHFQDMVRPVYD